MISEITDRGFQDALTLLVFSWDLLTPQIKTNLTLKMTLTSNPTLLLILCTLLMSLKKYLWVE